MTTIATDGKTMAGDGMITENDHVCLTDHVKVRRLSDGRLVGFCGNVYNWDEFASWLDRKATDAPPKVHDGFGCIILYPGGSIRSCDEHGRTFPELAPVAIGSGARFALAAMDLGMNAEDALKYTCTRDIYSGGEITVLESSILQVAA